MNRLLLFVGLCAVMSACRTVPSEQYNQPDVSIEAPTKPTTIPVQVSVECVDACPIELVPVSVEPDYLGLSVPLEGTDLIRPRRGPAGFLMMGGWEGASDSRAERVARELDEAGIRVMMSFHPLDSDLYEAVRDRGILIMHEQFDTMHSNHWNFHWYEGWDIPWQTPLLAMFDQYEPEEIAINCLHGQDRTGNASAFILSVRYGVPIEDAFYAVVDASDRNVTGVANVLEEFGCHDRREVGDEGVSTYAYEQREGMRADTSGFRRYIRETIEIALEMGAEFGDCVE